MASSAGVTGAEVLYTARSDLNVEQLGEKLVIQDPIKNTFTQLGTAEYIVFRCFDGKSTVDAIRDRLKQERDVLASSDRIMRLRDRLHAKQLLLAPGEVVTADDGPKIAEKSRGIARLVMIDLGLAFNPDVWLTRLFHRIKWVVFRPAFLVALALLVGLAATVWLRSWDDIRLQASNLDAAGSSLALYYVCLSLSIFAHEVAHGVTTKGFGGKVPRMGSFLYFFVFVFYTDVSASYLFPSKRRRLLVLFAAAMANVAICALATLIWRVTPIESFANQICFALMTINAVAASFTLFPLLRGDGYYIVSAALEVPNLRENAYRYTGAALRRAFIDRTTPLPKATDRQGLIYLCFAPLQVVFFIGFFGFVAVRTSLWLIDELQFVGFLIIVIVLVDRLGRSLLRVVPTVLEVIAEAIRRGPRPVLKIIGLYALDGMRWFGRMWKLDLVVGFVIAMLAFVPYQLHVSAPFEVISVAPVSVRSKTTGIIARYRVASGGWANAGDIVAELADDDLVPRRAVAAASLDEARAKLAELETGSRREDVASAKLSAEAQQSATAHAALELRRERNLYQQQIESRKNLEAAENAYRNAVARENESASELTMTEHASRAEELDRQRAVVAQAEQELAAVDQRLAWTKVKAVVSGRVVTPPNELEQRIGKHVGPGDPLIEIVAPDRLVARLLVPERFLQDVAVGMPVELRFMADPDVSYTVSLDRIEAAVTPRDGDSGVLGMHSVVASIKPTPPLGATGIAKIDAGSQSILELLLRRCHRASAVVFWSWW